MAPEQQDWWWIGHSITIIPVYGNPHLGRINFWPILFFIATREASFRDGAGIGAKLIQNKNKWVLLTTLSWNYTVPMLFVRHHWSRHIHAWQPSVGAVLALFLFNPLTVQDLYPVAWVINFMVLICLSVAWVHRDALCYWTTPTVGAIPRTPRLTLYVFFFNITCFKWIGDSTAQRMPPNRIHSRWMYPYIILLQYIFVSLPCVAMTFPHLLSIQPNHGHLYGSSIRLIAAKLADLSFVPLICYSHSFLQSFHWRLIFLEPL